MRKIGVITDAHANLPALEAALAAIDAEGCDDIVHTGDAIAIGPYPAECLDLLLSRPDIRLLMGNHDEYFAFGLPAPQPVWMSDNEWTHQQWTNAQLDAGLRGAVASWPYTYECAFRDGVARFCHYARRSDDSGFAPIINEPSPSDLDRLFGDEAEVIFYGHHHPRSDLRGVSRYINPGALGCNAVSEARFAILTIACDGSWHVEFHGAPYDRSDLIRAYCDRDVPAAPSLLRMFHGIDH